MKRLNMGKAKEILQLKEQGYSYRDIASSVGCGKTVVGKTLERAKLSGIISADKYTQSELEQILFPQKYPSSTNADEPDIEYILKELTRKHVTRQLLWEEYKLEHPNGLMYSQFCERIKQAKVDLDINYHKTHKAGEECEVDWAGSAIAYYELSAKKWRKAAIFVAVLPASAYPFVRAYPDQKTQSWIDAHIKAFSYFGGTPKILVPDCTKTAVVSPDLYEPILSKTYQEMAAHYSATIIPARPSKPKDKNYVENTVGNISRRILASLRDHRFTSITEINEQIAIKLDEFCRRPFQKLQGCRLSAFEKIDKPALRALPKTNYQLADFKICKIGINYHVCYDKFFYSVPFEYRGKESLIRATDKTLEVFVEGQRICAHTRHYMGNRYITYPEHLPDKHKVVSQYSDEHFVLLAGAYGDITTKFIKALLGSTEYSVQAYRMCMGVFREAKGIDPTIVESASKISLERGQLTSKYFGCAIKQALKGAQQIEATHVIEHTNIRGAQSFDRRKPNA